MKKILSFALCAALALTGCSESDDNNREIVLSNNSQTSQTIYADETTGDAEGIRFTATAPWTATVTPVSTKAEGGSSVDWLTLNAYSGGAGEFTLKLTLKENTTGADRQAKIEINCGSTTITITVEQKGTTEAGETPAPTPDDKYYITQIVEEGAMLDGDRNMNIIYFEYDEQGRMVKATTDDMGEGRPEDMYTRIITYENNQIIVNTLYPNDVDDLYQTVYTLDENGKVASYETQWDFGTGEKGKEWGTTEYDDEGYLLSATVKYENREDLVDKLEWQNGNLVKVHSDYYNDGASNNIAEMRYGNPEYVNNPKVNLDLTFAICESQQMNLIGSELPFMFSLGYTGKHNKLMMTHEYDKSEYGSNTQFEYEYDALQRPVRIIKTIDGSDIITYTITYQE